MERKTSVPRTSPRYVFIGGLHRSGTSLVAQAIASHPKVSGIGNSPAPENEGVYLQGAIPHTAAMGTPGSFAQDDDQHLTEGSRFNTLVVRDYLSAQWEPWFDPEAPWRVEKSPVNLTRARLMQQLFPLSHFIFVIRHPVAVSMATAKWSDRDLSALLGHWDDAHIRLKGDLPHLHNWMILRYEDIVSDPVVSLSRVWHFMSLPDHAADIDVRRDVNDGYFRDWSPTGTPMAAAEAFGYVLDPPNTLPMQMQSVRHVYRSVTEAAG